MKIIVSIIFIILPIAVLILIAIDINERYKKNSIIPYALLGHYFEMVTICGIVIGTIITFLLINQPS